MPEYIADPEKWNSLLLRFAGSGRQQIGVAKELVNRSLQADSEHPFLRISTELLGSQFVSVRFLGVDGAVAGEIRLSPQRIRESARTPQELALLVLYGAFPDAAPTGIRPNSLVDGLLPRRAEFKEWVADTVHTERTSLVIRRLTDGNSCRIIGQSSSGKTTTAQQVAHHLSTRGWTVCWLDLSQPDRGVGDLLVFLASTPAPERGSMLLVLDDCQANPSEATRIVRTINQLASVIACDVKSLVLAWESSAAFVQRLLPDSVVVQCSGSEVIPEIAREVMVGISDADLDDIVVASSGDVLLARLQMTELQASGQLPTIENLSDAILRRSSGEKILTPDQAQLLYRIASMTQFEIDTSIDYCHDGDRSVLSSLVALRLVRLTGHFVSVGHRSMARLLLRSLEQRYKDAVSGLERPGQIAVNYVRGAPPQQLVTTLERLDLARLSRDNTHRGEQHGTAFLARAWESLLIIVDMVAKQTDSDSSWSDNTASACFAGQALAEVAHPLWKEIADYLRGRWKAPAKPGSFEYSDHAPAERIDFDEIRRTMKEEDDEAIQFGVQLSREDADSIDLDRMHRTWALGLLLGFEGTARDSDTSRLRQLTECADAIQEPNGSFYPARVPWVTARVLLGLAATGASVRTSKASKRACDWLMRPAPDGPYQFGTWESGTGAWNTTLATTAMCAAALIGNGVPTTDPCISTATEYLIGQKDDWSRAGQEIDGAFAMATVLAVKGKWREVSRELERLITWLRAKESWALVSVRANEVHDESCKVAQIAGALISIVWTIVQRELPLLLEDLSAEIVRTTAISGRPRFRSEDIVRALDRLDESLSESIKGAEKTLEESMEIPSIVSDNLVRRRALRLELAKYRSRMEATRSDDENERIVTRINEIGRDVFVKTWVMISPIGEGSA